MIPTDCDCGGDGGDVRDDDVRGGGLFRRIAHAGKLELSQVASFVDELGRQSWPPVLF